MKIKQQIKPKALGNGKQAGQAKILKKSAGGPVKNVAQEKNFKQKQASFKPSIAASTMKKTKKQAVDSDEEDEDDEDTKQSAGNSEESDEDDSVSGEVEGEDDDEDEDDDDDDDDDESEDDDEDEEENKNEAVKGNGKIVKAAAADEDDDDDESEDEDEDEKEDENEAVKGNGKIVKAAAADEDDDDDEEEDGDDDEDSDDSENAAPVEKPIEKATQKVSPAAAFSTNEVPKDANPEQVVFVSKLPKKGDFQIADLVEVFAKYGTLKTVHPFYKKLASFAQIYYSSADEAKAALSANKTEINGSKIVVKLQKAPSNAVKEDKPTTNTTFAAKIGNLPNNTKVNELQAHFDAYEIDNIHYPKNQKNTYQHQATIYFKDEPNCKKAIAEQHNSVFKNKNISVQPLGHRVDFAAETSVIISNNKGLQYIEKYAELKEVFEQCGPVQCINIYCSPKIVGMVNFANAQAAAKALKLSGTNKAGIDLEILPYKADLKGNTVAVTNLKTEVTEEDLRKVFEKAGKIDFIQIFNNKFTSGANIRFSDSDGYCKSFLLNETPIQGKPIFLMPLATKKLIDSHAKRPFQQDKQQQGEKRPYPNWKSNQQGEKRPYSNWKSNQQGGGPYNKKPRFNPKQN